MAIAGLVAAAAAATAASAGLRFVALGGRPNLAPHALRSAPPTRPRGRCAGLGAAAVAVAAGLELVKEEFREEAERCWSVGEDGLVPGWLADMTPAGREYNTMVLMYEDASSKPRPMDDRPWKRLPGAVTQVIPGDKREEDLALATAFFGPAVGQPRPGGVVLDLGCGWGYIAKRLAQTGNYDLVLASDVAWSPLEIGRADIENEGVGPEQGLLMLRADAQELPFKSETADYVYGGMCLHKVADPAAALREVSRVLRPGGKLYATLIPGMKLKQERVEVWAKEAGLVEVSAVVPSTFMYLRASKPAR